MKDIISRLTWVDFIVLLAVVRGGYVGYRSGLFPELLRIAAYVITVIVTLYFHDGLAQFLTLNTFLNETTAKAVSFASLLAVMFLVTKLIIMLLLRLLKVGEGGFIYKSIGATLGVARWIILLSLLFMLVERLPLKPLQTDIHEHSLTGREVSKMAPLLFDFLSTFSPQPVPANKNA